jgi:hypothetical protein
LPWPPFRSRARRRAPIEVHGLLGIKRRGDRLALTIDDPKAFVAAVA